MKNQCDHKRKKDLSQGLGNERHDYCLDCGTHWYKGRVWNCEQWSAWIESAIKK